MSLEPRLQLIERLQNATHECLKDLVPDGPHALLDFPDIRNVGDSAIWLGELAYLKSRFNQRPAYVSKTRDLITRDLERAVPDGPIFIHGGGNFGDIWESHQDFREQVLDRWPDRLIVQFPQSIHYQSDARADETARVIARHKRFVLLVRDEESRHFAERRFDCEIRLCPDMAFGIGPVDPVGRPDLGVLAMLRADKETTGPRDMGDHAHIPVEDWISESKARVRIAKAIGILGALTSFNACAIKAGKFNAAARNRFERGRRQLSRAEAIVTDRLHVHIISLLLGKPHAVLDNSYGKIGRFMAAFSGGTDLTYAATSLSDAMEWAQSRGR